MWLIVVTGYTPPVCFPKSVECTEMEEVAGCTENGSMQNSPVEWFAAALLRHSSAAEGRQSGETFETEATDTQEGSMG